MVPALGHQDDRQVGAAPEGGGEEVKPIRPGHDEIGDEEVQVAGDGAQCLLPSGTSARGVRQPRAARNALRRPHRPREFDMMPPSLPSPLAFQRAAFPAPTEMSRRA
jgi:hypothetical protein